MNEDQRTIMEIHGHVVGIKATLESLDKRFAKHEEEDEEAHKRLASLEGTRDKGKFLLTLIGGFSSVLGFLYWAYTSITTIAHAQ